LKNFQQVTIQPNHYWPNPPILRLDPPNRFSFHSNVPYIVQKRRPVQTRYFAGLTLSKNAPFPKIRLLIDIFLRRGHRFPWRKFRDPRIGKRSPYRARNSTTLREWFACRTVTDHLFRTDQTVRSGLILNPERSGSSLRRF
jgi:hypothetical protein